MKANMQTPVLESKITESLEIRNAGPLRHIDIPDLKPFTVIIGPSGSGKSLLMKIIVLMRYIFKMYSIRSYLKAAGLRHSPFRMRTTTLFRDDLKAHLAAPDTFISYTVVFPSGNQLSIIYKDNKLTSSFNGKTGAFIPESDLVFSKESWISETRNVIPAWISNPANAKGSLGFYFHETLADFSEASKNFSAVSKKGETLDLSFLNATLTIQTLNGIPSHKFGIPGVHTPIELRHASSGIQTAAPLAMIVTYFATLFSFKEAKKRSILTYLYENDSITSFHAKRELSDIPSVVNIHIEEPELSLDPSTQVRLIDYLVEQAFNHPVNPMTLMLATHSPYIVNALNLIVNRPSGHAASLPANHTAVYNLSNGSLVNLVAEDSEGHPVINTSDLTEPMQAIYKDYLDLI